MTPLTSLTHPTPDRTRPARRARRPRALALVLAALVVALVAFSGAGPAGAARAPQKGGVVLAPPGETQLRPIGEDPPDPPEPPDPPDPPEPPVPPEPEPPVVYDPPPPPPPNPECDATAGFARPAGVVPPGYVYSPTAFDGTVADPQPDDTFAADAAGHPAFVGKLRTRMANGREELLVCAHVGTNVADDALTPFATTGPGSHPATITARVALIDATGTTTTYDLGAAGIEGSMSHYAGSTDVHEGIAQLWVPFTPNLHEPGFITRVEIRGTAALPNGGTTKVMGADEVYVHLGPAPTAETSRVPEAVGVALDDSVIAERPTDPGADDLSSLLAPHLEPILAEKIEAMAPAEIPGDWDWEPEVVTTGVKASGTLNSLDTFVHSFKLDVENFNATEGRVRVSFQGTIRPKITLRPRSRGLVSIISGSCQVESFMNFSATASFTINLADGNTRPVIDVGFIQASATANFVTARGDLWALYGIFPAPLNCRAIEGEIRGGVIEQVDEKLRAMRDDDDLKATIECSVNDVMAIEDFPCDPDDPPVQPDPGGAADLAHGPLSQVGITLPGGVGFDVSQATYVPTAPLDHIGGSVHVAADGINVAAGALVSDGGGVRFPYSYTPSSTSSVPSAIGGRTRNPSGDFDLAVVVNGATVNQLGRALTAGRWMSDVVAPPPTEVTQLAFGPMNFGSDHGLLDQTTSVHVAPGVDLPVGIHPSSPVMYLPTPPAGWPAPGQANLYVPSLRISIPLAGVATLATDVRVGADVTIDGGGHLLPLVAETSVSTRFLRLGSTTNVITDPAVAPLEVAALASAMIAATVPTTVASVLRPIAIPDLDNGLGTRTHLTNLSVATIGGGHLVAYADLAPGTTPSEPADVLTTWASDGSGAPTSFTTNVIPTNLPGSAPVVLDWTVTDQNSGAVVYRSPAGGEAAQTRTFPGTGLARTIDPCSGDQTVSVAISVTITRGANTRTQTGTAGYTFPGTAPTNPPQSCWPEPEPEPEPEPDPEDPPICLKQPWKCPSDDI